MRSTGPLKAAVAILAFTGSAKAQNPRTIASSGSWSALEGTTTDGVRYCAISTGWADDRAFIIRFTSNNGKFAFIIGKSSWSIPADSKARIQVTLGGNTPWGGSFSPNDTSSFLLQIIRPEDFFQEFRTSKYFIVAFPDGSEMPWTGSLVGSAIVTAKMASCIAKLPGPPTHTQPFAAPQPNNAPPAGVAEPTQPGSTL